MTKDLTDCDQPSALTQQFTGQRVPEPMRPHLWQPSSLAGPFDDVTDQVGTDRSTRGATGQEQMNGICRVPAAR